jgi:hypothetical protein
MQQAACPFVIITVYTHRVEYVTSVLVTVCFNDTISKFMKQSPSTVDNVRHSGTRNPPPSPPTAIETYSQQSVFCPLIEITFNRQSSEGILYDLFPKVCSMLKIAFERQATWFIKAAFTPLQFYRLFL